MNKVVQAVILSVTLIALAAPGAGAGERARSKRVLINGVGLGDAISTIREASRDGKCIGEGKDISECVIRDGMGVGYYVLEGAVLTIIIDAKTAPGVKLPFGLKMGEGAVASLRRISTEDGQSAFVRKSNAGILVSTLIYEEGADYEFQLELDLDPKAGLVSVEYKDVI